jgi:FAD-dependent urate hydroxylase
MKPTIDVRIADDFYPAANYDVVVGAGPYGLSTAAHLLGYGLKVSVFGTPFQLWRENMPRGMLLRSYWWATNLSDQGKQL